jgi:diphthamide synthase (EF-2-diphthine--ammonia ligase)
VTGAVLSWSGGKESCLAPRELQRTPDVRIEALLTTMTRDFDRISMHGVRRVLLERQAERLGLPLHQILISQGATNREYETAMSEAVALWPDRGVHSVAFGDLFLADIRAYRERLLDRNDMVGRYPIWGRNTVELIRGFIGLGFRTAVVPHIDPCGENREFHTFVFDGPMFRNEVRFSFGEAVFRDSLWFRDLLPAE